MPKPIRLRASNLMVDWLRALRSTSLFAPRLWIALALTVGAGVARSDWKSVGPYGGDAYNLKVLGGNLFAVAGSGIWRSPDGGASWTWVQTSDPYNITDLATLGQNLYAINDGVFRSTDGGVSWEHLTVQVQPEDVISMRVGQAVASLGRFLIDGTSSGIFRSADSGITWTRVDGYRDSVGGPVDVYHVETQGAYVFASTSSRGLFVSPDSGAEGTWSNVGKVRDGDVGFAVAMGRYLFLDGWDGLTRSADRGRTWDTLSRVPAQGLLPQGKILYRTTWPDTSLTPGAKPAFYQSLDSGSTWIRKSEGLAILRLTARADSLFVTVQGRGVMTSIDSGRHFEPCPIPVSFIPVLSVAGNRVLALGDKDMGDFVSADGGANWTRTTEPGAGSGFVRMAVRGSLGFAVDYAYHGFVSKDSGKTWRPVPGGFPVGAGVTGLTQSVAIHAGVLFVAIRDGIYRSRDTGTTWTQVRPQKAQSFQDGVILFSAGDKIQLWESAGIFRSIDTGAHWVAAQKSPAGIIRAISENRNGIYAAGERSVFHSSDGGDTWLEGKGGQLSFNYLAAVERGLLASNNTQGMFFSQDGGDNWSAVNAGLPGAFGITSLSVTATDAYIGVQNAGLWRRPLAELADVTGLSRPTPESKDPAVGLRLFRTGSGIGIEFSLSRPGWARLEAFDYRGRRLAVLADGRLGAGRHSVMLPAGIAQAGIRILRLRAEGKVLSRVAAAE